jgi:hypothetical protein
VPCITRAASCCPPWVLGLPPLMVTTTVTVGRTDCQEVRLFPLPPVSTSGCYRRSAPMLPVSPHRRSTNERPAGFVPGPRERTRARGPRALVSRLRNHVDEHLVWRRPPGTPTGVAGSRGMCPLPVAAGLHRRAGFVIRWRGRVRRPRSPGPGGSATPLRPSTNMSSETEHERARAVMGSSGARGAAPRSGSREGSAGTR